MSRTVEFVGGNHDGLRLSTVLGEPFLWVDGKRCHRAPARGRVLYRAMGDPMFGTEITSYRYVGGTHGLCKCGAYRKRQLPCPMCGSTVLIA